MTPKRDTPQRVLDRITRITAGVCAYENLGLITVREYRFADPQIPIDYAPLVERGVR